MKPRIEKKKIITAVKLLENGVKQADIAEILGVNVGVVSKASMACNAIASGSEDRLSDLISDVRTKYITEVAMEYKGFTISVDEEKPEADVKPVTTATDNGNTMYGELVKSNEQIIQYMAALNKKLSELDANLQKVMVDCQRQSNANTDVLMTELSKMTSLLEGIKCNTRKGGQGHG